MITLGGHAPRATHEETAAKGQATGASGPTTPMGRPGSAAGNRPAAPPSAPDSTRQVAEGAPATPAHGTQERYLDGCHCKPCCRAENARLGREYRRHKARELWGAEPPKRVDADPAREHVRRLQASGLSLVQIGELAGVPTRTISSLLYSNGGLPPTRRLVPATSQALLAVEATDLPTSGWLSPIGTQRRLRALTAAGWPARELAKHVGLHHVHISRLIRGQSQYVTPSTVRAVRDLYDALWDQLPPMSAPGERCSATKARKLAQRNGWAPPLAWDDDLIDLPDEELAVELERRVEAMDDDELTRCCTARKYGDHSPLIVAGARKHDRRRRKAANAS